jgi:predicted nucleotidyltransferase
MSIDFSTSNQIKNFVLSVLPDSKVYVFGSRARGDNRPFSDYDIAVDNGAKIDLSTILKIVGKIDDSNIPYNVDIVDFYGAEGPLKENIIKERVAI